MNWSTEKKQVINAYRDQFKKFGIHNKSLFFPGRKQNVRFNVIKEIGVSSKDSLLDVGCGFGDLYKYLKETIKYQGSYTGIDLLPEFVEICKSRFPDIDFRVLDILQDEIAEKWDYVALTGTLNITPGVDHLEFIKSMITKMFHLSKKGVSVDFISSYGDDRNKNVYRADPAEIFTFCKTLTKRVSLRNDYLPWEFCVYLYKDDSITEDKIFSEYKFSEIIEY